jgi:segregation and condensation protein A
VTVAGTADAVDGCPNGTIEADPRGGPARAEEAAVERPQPPATYRVRLSEFEGPLDLLLHLIQQHELDIMDIPIAFVTQEYVAYIRLMQELNIDLASEYLVMAATLAHIKSKMLLPPSPEDEEDAELEPEVDPRSELVRRLLEYQKYRDAGEQLGGRGLLGRDVFVRGVPAPTAEGPAPLAPVSLFKLLEAFQSVIDRAELRVDHQVDLEHFSITDRINELSDLLRVKHRVRFEELFAEQQTRSALIITFLALLEMTRLRLTRLLQQGPLEPIEVELTVTDDVDQQDVAGAVSSDREAAAAAGSRPTSGPGGTTEVGQPPGLGSDDCQVEAAERRQAGLQTDERGASDAGEDADGAVQVPDREQE